MNFPWLQDHQFYGAYALSLFNVFGVTPYVASFRQVASILNTWDDVNGLSSFSLDFAQIICVLFNNKCIGLLISFCILHLGSSSAILPQ